MVGITKRDRKAQSVWHSADYWHAVLRTPDAEAHEEYRLRRPLVRQMCEVPPVRDRRTQTRAIYDCIAKYDAEKNVIDSDELKRKLSGETEQKELFAGEYSIFIVEMAAR